MVCRGTCTRGCPTEPRSGPYDRSKGRRGGRRRWEPVDVDVREDAVDFYCELVLELDAEGDDEEEIAERIRFMLGKCFVE
jgi:hypothetical protein